MKFGRIMSGKKFIILDKEVPDKALVMIKLIGKVPQAIEGKTMTSAVFESNGQLAIVEDDAEVIELL